MFVLVTSGLGGMSGAQPKAANIAGALVSITAEVNPKAAIQKLSSRDGLMSITENVDQAIEVALEKQKTTSTFHCLLRQYC